MVPMNSKIIIANVFEGGIIGKGVLGGEQCYSVMMGDPQGSPE